MIGQRYDVKLHIPYFTDTDSEKLYDLFNDGFNLFTQPNPVAQNLYNDLSYQASMSIWERFNPRIKTHSKLCSTAETDC